MNPVRPLVADRPRGHSRRQILAGAVGIGAGGAAVATETRAGPSSAAAIEQARPGESARFIDVHAHWAPPTYLAALERAGIRDVDGFPIPPWDEASHLAVMDRHGIAASVLSISAPGLLFAKPSEARALARRLNEEAAERRNRSGGRFGAFALLVLPDVEGSLVEMAYALDVLKLDGIGLYTNVHGTYMGDPMFEPIFAEAHRRGAVVYTHPIAPPNFAAVSLSFPAPAIEYPFDTTRMLLNLVATGTLVRFPGLKLIASHGGGTLPYLAERVATMVSLFDSEVPPTTSAQALAQLRDVYFDTTAVANPTSLASYCAFVPPQRRLFGTDTPFMRELSIPPAMAALKTPANGVANTDFDALAYGNAERLFGGLLALQGRAR